MTEAEPTRTRRALHAVAELVLAGPQYRHGGTVRLRITPGGFATTVGPAIAVVGSALVGPGATVAISGRTAEELAVAVGVVAGAPADLYSDGSGATLDEALVVDPAIATRLAEAYAVGDAAMRRIAPATEPVLWPEHFDVGVRVEEVNYGVSPGDGFIDEPYAYVGVHPVPADDPFWNAPFGVAEPMTTFAGVDELAEFFTSGARHRRG